MFSLATCSYAFATAPPPATEHAVTARWMAKTITWGYLSTISTRNTSSTPGERLRQAPRARARKLSSTDGGLTPIPPQFHQVMPSATPTPSPT